MKPARPGALAHIVNNASMAALVTHAIPGLGLYSVSKQALLAYSEALAQEEAEAGLTVSLLACGLVATGLGRNSQDYIAARDEGRAPAPTEKIEAQPGVMSAETAGEIVARGIEANRFLILTHPERRSEIAARYDRFLAEIDLQAAN
jgi:short-subunit dehydrogenase